MSDISIVSLYILNNIYSQCEVYATILAELERLLSWNKRKINEGWKGEREIDLFRRK